MWRAYKTPGPRKKPLRELAKPENSDLAHDQFRGHNNHKTSWERKSSKVSVGQQSRVCQHKKTGQSTGGSREKKTRKKKGSHEKKMVKTFTGGTGPGKKKTEIAQGKEGVREKKRNLGARHRKRNRRLAQRTAAKKPTTKNTQPRTAWWIATGRTQKKSRKQTMSTICNERNHRRGCATQQQQKTGGM